LSDRLNELQPSFCAAYTRVRFADCGVSADTFEGGLAGVSMGEIEQATIQLTKRLSQATQDVPDFGVAVAVAPALETVANAHGDDHDHNTSSFTS
jgi:hypothetical protein